MSAHISADQTPTGWRVEVTDGDDVIVETDGPNLSVTIRPENDDAPPTPLDVTLAQ